MGNIQTKGKQMDISTHNGILTVKSTKTGEHRTFQIRTQAEDAKFAPGKRIISLLVGPDNTSDYQSFGFVECFHSRPWVLVWKKHKGTQFEALARMLQNQYNLERDGKIELNLEGTCRRCNRPLTTPESVRKGIGPICEEKE